MGNENSSIGDTQLTVLLIGVATAALVVTIYHCLPVGWCRPHPANNRPQRRRATEALETPSSIENSAIHLIPAHKYQKGDKMVGKDGVCAICLSEYEEEEELRTLPECMHSFHVPCIDMWLYSHSSCPMCRSDTTPSPQIIPMRRLGSAGSEEADQEVTVTLEGIVVQPHQVL
ncbi:RING-H2 finger protein ATL52-like [Eucalyptus grandis]|uniref:RING-H2 finger protein ATL52-like n=1 Tax=Eucalyptus grandis TaxID=71139 RepID=UPI00052491CE|nr:RING-H2 finger protein ATL52-like [Eucalyptus grandis]